MKIGYVTDYLNRPLGDALAPASGVVLFIRAVPSLVKGNTIVDVGVVKQPVNSMKGRTSVRREAR